MIRKFYDAAAEGAPSGGATTVEPIDTKSELAKMKGHFVGVLQRSNKDIRDDRALTIAQKAKRSYRRKIEDILDEIKELRLRRLNMLDLSPTDRNSLVLGNNFDADDFVSKNLDLGKQIENLEITLRIATEEYEFLFGEKIERD